MKMIQRYSFVLLVVFSILKSTAGYGQWAKQNSGSSQNLYTIYPISKDTALAFSKKNVILKTTNGGATWDSIITAKFPVEAIAHPGKHTFIISSTYGILYRTDDAGKTWQKITFDHSINLELIFFTSASTGYSSDGMFLYKTTDSGRNWVNTNLAGTTSASLPKMQFTSPTIAYFLSGTQIYRTTNAWNTDHHYVIDQHITFNNFTFPTAKTGYACGASGAIYKSIDSGLTWAAQNKGTSVDDELSGIFFLNDSTGYVCGKGGVIYYTKDGGKLWKLQPSGTTEDLFDIYFSSKDSGMAVGNNGTILRTTNGGFAGIEVVNNEKNIIARVFPNPTGHVLNIKLWIPTDKDISIKVYNQAGQVVSETKANGQDTIQINLDALPVGMYAYSIMARTNNQNYYQKGTVQVLR